MWVSERSTHRSPPAGGGRAERREPMGEATGRRRSVGAGWGVVPPSWASLPLDPGTARVLRHGCRVLYDPGEAPPRRSDDGFVSRPECRTQTSELVPRIKGVFGVRQDAPDAPAWQAPAYPHGPRCSLDLAHLLVPEDTAAVIARDVRTEEAARPGRPARGGQGRAMLRSLGSRRHPARVRRRRSPFASARCSSCEHSVCARAPRPPPTRHA